MAGASQKKQAAANTQTLKEIHTISLAVNLLTILCLFIFQRPATKKYFFLYLIPLVCSEVFIEINGRPKYETNKSGTKVLITLGDDLRQSGFTEYLFDIIYLTLLCDILMVLFGSNKVWYLYLAIPIFAVYKIVQLVQLGKKMFGMGSAGKAKEAEEVSPGSSLSNGKSKRQTKLENRSKKQQVRYR